MTVFDLLFLACLFTAIATLVFAHRHWRQVLIAAGVYMTIVIVVSLVSPRRVFALRQPQCSDDWCIAVEDFTRAPSAGGTLYSVDLRISSRARRVSQRERNVAVYLIDHRGVRYDPVRATGAPFDALLNPGDALVATRTFLLPAEAHDVAAVVAREGGFPIGWFIIGYNTWFRRPPIVRLP